MAQETNGGPAFPGTTSQPNERGVFYPVHHQGMSLRDWFAGQALPQAVEDYGQPSRGTSTGQRLDRGNPILPWASAGSGTREEIIARQAYRYADAMIAASAQTEEQANG